MVVKIRTDKSDVSVVIDSSIAFDFCYGFLGAKGDIASSKGYVFLATTPLPIIPSMPSTCKSDMLPPVAFRVKSLFIKKPTFVEPSVLNSKLDPPEALKCLEFINTPGV